SQPVGEAVVQTSKTTARLARYAVGKMFCGTFIISYLVFWEWWDGMRRGPEAVEAGGEGSSSGRDLRGNATCASLSFQLCGLPFRSCGASALTHRRPEWQRNKPQRPENSSSNDPDTQSTPSSYKRQTLYYAK